MTLPHPLLPRLLQLASPMLPVGAYSYSQGLEWAIENGQVHDRASAEGWIGDVLRHGLARFEAPLWWRLYHAWARRDFTAVAEDNALFVASRETAELRAESLQMGTSLRRLLLDIVELDAAARACLCALDPLGFPAAYTLAAHTWAIPAPAALQAYLWGWLENQASVLMKAVPLGQTDGQRLLLRLGADIPAVADAAAHADSLSNFLPGLAIASCRHETQYSRLFRS
jgi:urease accessory protein